MFKKKFLITVSIIILSLFFISGFSMANYKPNKNYEGTTISFYTFPNGAGYNQALNKLLKEFKDMTGITVKPTILSWGEGNRVILSSIVAGNAPDVIYTTPSRALPIIRFGSNVIEPLDKYIVEDKISEKVVYQEAVENYKWGGTTYAVGHYGDPHPMGVNLDVLRNSGVEEKYIEKLTDPDKVWTWEDFNYILSKTTQDTNADGKIDQWGLGYPGGENNVSHFLNWYWNVGGTVIDTEGNIGIGGEKTKMVFDLFEKINKKGYIIDGASNMSSDDMFNAFLDSKVAFSNTYPAESYISRSEKGEDLPEISAIYPPEAPNGERGIFFGWNGVMMSSNSDNKEASWEFIKFMAISDEYKKMMAELSGKLTPVTNKEDINNLIQKEYRKALQIGLDASEKGWFTRHEPAHPASSRIVRGYNSAMQNILSGQMTAEEATNWIREEAEAAKAEVE